MKLYVTNADYEKVKNSFLNFRSFSVINVQEIIKSFGYENKELSEYAAFIINKEIQSLIKESALKKKYFNIIYINNDLSSDTIVNLKYFLDENVKIEKFILIDNKENQTNILSYPLFDEIIFFPEAKRTKIIHCDSIKNPMYHWINNRV